MDYLQGRPRRVCAAPPDSNLHIVWPLVLEAVQALQHTLGYEFRVHVDNDPARIIAGLHTYKYIASPLQVSTDVTEWIHELTLTEKHGTTDLEALKQALQAKWDAKWSAIRKVAGLIWSDKALGTPCANLASNAATANLAFCKQPPASNKRSRAPEDVVAFSGFIPKCKVLVVELFSGTATVSAAAKSQGCFNLTYELQKKFVASNYRDLSAVGAVEEVVVEIDALVKANAIEHVHVHLSPPCQQFSTLQRTNPFSQAAFDAAVQLTLNGLKIASRYNGYSCENPGTGTMWIQPALMKYFSFPVAFDYCRVGACGMRKRTIFAFKSEDQQVMFVGDGKLYCEGRGKCPSMKGESHTSIEQVPQVERSRIPAGVATRLINTVMAAAAKQPVQRSNKIVDFFTKQKENKIDTWFLKQGQIGYVQMDPKDALHNEEWDLDTVRRFSERFDMYAVEKVLETDEVHKKVRIKWRDYDDASWEPASSLEDL